MEEIDDTLVTSEHDRLTSAISKLDKTQHITEPSRSEPTNLTTEFNLIKGSKILKVNDVTQILGVTAHRAQIGRKLKSSQQDSKILPKPLERPQAERIKRTAGYEGAKIKVGRWDPVVATSRTADFVSFPLKQSVNKLQPTQEFLSKFQLKSKLEKALDEIDPPVIEEEESDNDNIYPMSYQEMLEHRQQSAKFRAQQTYKAAKAKYQSKIKSKKYHRILKKERLKQQLKEFEELQISNPEEALKKLELLEKSRALERHTLRHKNTGKWAKSKLIRAKYDKDVRQQLADQLGVSRELTNKINVSESTDDEADGECIPDLTLSQDPLNPWMMKRSDKTKTDAEFDFGYKKFLKNRMFKHQEISSGSDSENDVDDSNALTKAPFDVGRHKFSVTEEIIKPKNETLIATSDWNIEMMDRKATDIKPSASVSSIFKPLEGNLIAKVNRKIKKLRKNVADLDKLEKKLKQKPKEKYTSKFDNLEYLKLKNNRKKAIIDEELVEVASKEIQDGHYITDKILNIQNTISHKSDLTTTLNIDPNRFINVQPKHLNSIVSENAGEMDQLDDEEQVVPKVNIEDVFEEDDVVASFRLEKEDEINQDKPVDIDLSLPGWGTWGGKGLKVSKRKRNRFILKAPPKVQRRDENKGDIIIKEYKDPKLSAHKVKDVPFPFSSVKDYEATIRAPIGNTFVPEQAHQKLIKPSIFTKAGTIIDPMDEDELLVKKNLTFNNESVIKLLGKK